MSTLRDVFMHLIATRVTPANSNNNDIDIISGHCQIALESISLTLEVYTVNSIKIVDKYVYSKY
jgi:hypothetical protein